MLRYATSIFLGAFLLFQVQPIIAKHILPWFGGTPAVWTTCMVFFQLLLLAGYAYAHLVISRLKPRTQAIVHGGLLLASVGLLAVLTSVWGVPIIPSASLRPPDASLPIWRIIQLLAMSVGLPYLILSTTSPLMQAWFSRTHPGVSPYRLYTLSNIGSFLALISYPLVFEPAFTVQMQGALWSGAFVLFVLAYGYCALQVWRLNPEDPCETPGEEASCPPPPTLRTKWLWVGLPALASTMLLAATNQMCQAVAVVPFLWVLPLSLYLLSFIICFDNERWYVRRVFLPLLLLAAPAAMYAMGHQNDILVLLQIAIHALALFVCCMVCHGELVAMKPHPRYLTGFYLAISIGGALGGVFVAILAPQIFNDFWEYPLSLFLCWLLGIGVLMRRPKVWPVYGVHVGRALLIPSICVPFVAGFMFHKDEAKKLGVSRNFYGVCWVGDWNAEQPEWHQHILYHGKIIHGYQFQAPDKQQMPCSYFHPDGGVGLAFRYHPRRLAGEGLKIGVLGLGVGGIAAYAEAPDTIRYYEINPDVIYLARDAGYFTYLTGCRGKVETVLGDARISLERELKSGSQQFDVLVMDAFSGDTVPAHLLTKEAFEVYLKHLRGPDGVIIVNVTNRFLNLPPVVYEAAKELGLDVVQIHKDGDSNTYATADFMLLTRPGSYLRSPQIAARAEKRDDTKHVRLWTDDFHNMFQILR